MVHQALEKELKQNILSKNIIVIKQKDTKITLKGFNPKPSDKIAINSLSFFNLIKHNRRPKINMNGSITVIKFGIKNKESNKISKTSICKKFVTVKSLVIWSSQATDKKINKIKKKYLIIWENK